MGRTLKYGTVIACICMPGADACLAWRGKATSRAPRGHHVPNSKTATNGEKAGPTNPLLKIKKNAKTRRDVKNEG